MRRVLIVGGLAASLLNFRAPVIKALIRRGCRVYVAVPGPFSAELTSALAALGVEIRAIRMARAALNPVADLRTLLGLFRLMRDLRPDAVLSYTAKPVIYSGYAAHFARVAVRCGWITGVGFGFTEGEPRGRTVVRYVLRVLYRTALKRYQVVLFQNADDVELFRRLGLISDACRVEITAGSGVDTAMFSPVDLPEGPVFLMAARLLKDKGVFEYVAAAQKVRYRHPQARFLLAGEPDQNPSSVTQGQLADWVRSGVVEYLGWADDIRVPMARARVYVLPSYREGMPRSVLEAMAMGRPVISTRAPGCRDAVEDGYTGLLVPVADSDALAGAMVRLIENPTLAEQMGRAGRRRVVDRFDASRVGEHVARLLVDSNPV